MSQVQEIEEAVERLSAAELESFRSWFSMYDAAQWDAKIEMNISAGQLDLLAAEALADFHAGRAREL